MSVESLLIFLLIGAVAGWLAGIVVRGGGFGLIGDIVVGVIGSFIGGWLFTSFRLIHGGGLLGAVIGATAGAVVVLFLVRLVRRRPLLHRIFRRWA
jgi:uncharacterized membrane protein YeaQ/YmgE (transglycosylase-associated protein family)